MLEKQLVNKIKELPIDAPPYLNFETNEIKCILDTYQNFPKKLDKYYYFGFDGSGNPICFDKISKNIVLIDHEDYKIQLINDNIDEFIEFLELYENHINLVYEKNKELEVSNFDFCINEIEILEKNMKSRNSKLFTSSSFWKTTLEMDRGNVLYDKKNFINKHILYEDKIKKEYDVGKISAMSMYISLLFIVFQPIIFVFLSPIFLLLPSVFLIKEKILSNVSLLILIFLEVILIILIKKHIRKKYSDFEIIKQINDQNYLYIFNENILEVMINITSLVGFLWLHFFIKQSEGLKYFFIIVNGFGLIFFIIFLFVRVLLTKILSIRTILSILLCSLFIYCGVIDKSLFTLIGDIFNF